MIPITPDTPLATVLATVPQARAIIDAHGCTVEDECPDLVRDMPLSECEYVCHLDDLDGLIQALNGVDQR